MACTPGLYGDNCTQTCRPSKCLDNTCHPDTGLCIECGGNFNGSTCSECKAGYYRSGDSCYPCSSLCAGSQCDPSNGSCIGCVDGRHGATCNTTCSPAGCQTCHQHNGNCTACRPLYNLDHTSQCKECKDGFSKHNSSICSPCSVSCKDRLCHGDTGDCVQGCRPGYHGQQCEELCSTIADQCVQCNQSGECTACSGHFQPPQCTGMKDESSQQSSVPVGSAILGAGLMLTVALLSVLVFLCWKHRSQKTVQDAETVAGSSSDPVTAPNNVYTAPPTASSSISPSASAQAGDVTPHVIRDPGNTYEKLRIYSNMVFDREAHSEPEPRGTDVTKAL
ncbi:cell death abnormality protein 1-like [Littorina saxatilis]|uniref:cell death abnormality protein 1-like n=1 Tax=Littorina saxatilis TaxID=31220 RepID=UPI0038B5B0E2